MTPLGQLIDSIADAGDGRFTVNASDDWRQGRTLYGGVSAGLCYAACERLVPDLPPLRSAQIAFIGPSGGEATLVPTVLRRGKSVTFMACDLLADGVVAMVVVVAARVIATGKRAGRQTHRGNGEEAANGFDLMIHEGIPC